MPFYSKTEIENPLLNAKAIQEIEANVKDDNGRTYDSPQEDDIPSKEHFPCLVAALQTLLNKSTVDISGEEELRQIDNLFSEIVSLKSKKNKYEFTYEHVDSRDERKQMLLKVPYASTDASFRKSRHWIDIALSCNSPTPEDAVTRIIKYLVQGQYYETVVAALEDEGVPVTSKMDTLSMAAMFNDAGISTEAKKKILKHLRYHFGSKSFAPLHETKMYGEGYTEVKTGVIEYKTDETKIMEKIPWSVKDAAAEVASQLCCQLNSKAISLDQIERLDFVVGGDHGKGVFIFCGNIVVVLRSGERIKIEVVLAEILCRKDTADLIKNTILDDLKAGLETLYEGFIYVIRNNSDSQDIIISKTSMTEPTATPVRTRQQPVAVSRSNKAVKKRRVDEQVLVLCQREPPTQTSHLLYTFKVNIYMAGDLAFYGIPLGRESMSGSWCYLCNLSYRQMQDLSSVGEEWTIEKMTQHTEKTLKGAARLGMKEAPLLTFIPVLHYISLLLHALIGVGNDLLTHFRFEVGMKIENWSEGECEARQTLSAVKTALDEVESEKKTFSDTYSGKIKSLKGKVTRKLKALERLGILEDSNEREVTTATRTVGQSSVTMIDVSDLINQSNNFLEDEDDEVDVMVGDIEVETEVTHNLVAHVLANVHEHELSEYNEQVAKLRQELKDLQQELSPLKETWELLLAKFERGRKLVKAWNAIISQFESKRKKSDTGIESKLFAVMKLVGVELARYHGGKLIGKDVKRVMYHADYVFGEFTKILQQSKKEDCSMSDDDIENMCNKYARAFLLWDGAFSLARKLSPTAADIEQYRQYSTAAIRYHQEIGCTITIKGHIMFQHVIQQLLSIPGGLGDKAEDWIERQHQEQTSLRKRFDAIATYNKKASRMQEEMHKSNHPALRRKVMKVHEKTARTLEPEDETVAYHRQCERVKRRKIALEEWTTRSFDV